jgi:nitrite reductase/ring-hydroxylating ferredoxin subunit
MRPFDRPLPSPSAEPDRPADAFLDRRQFLRTVTALTAMGSGWGWNGPQHLLADVTPPDRTAGLLQVRLSDHPTLQQSFGSIRIGTTPVGGERPLFYPVLINRDAAGAYHAVSAECTHEGCILPPLNRSTQRTTCPCHGSRFLVDGSVVPRSVARQPLRSFRLRRTSDDLLTIELPDMAVALRPIAVLPNPRRVALEFIAFEGIRYELRGRASLADAGTVAPFSLTADGALSQTVLAGTGDFVRIYADLSASVGFYSIAMQAGIV